MPNIKLTLQYDGTRYLGWTRPAADGYAKTISYRISSVLQKMTGEDITLFAGAKTAPGVHALCQTVNFHTESPFSDTYFFTFTSKYFFILLFPLKLTGSLSPFLRYTFSAQHRINAFKKYLYI